MSIDNTCFFIQYPSASYIHGVWCNGSTDHLHPDRSQVQFPGAPPIERNSRDRHIRPLAMSPNRARNKREAAPAVGLNYCRGLTVKKATVKSREQAHQSQPTVSRITAESDDKE